jgi:hypothetical protein
VSLLFLFIQFEFTHAIGPHAARYVVEPGVLDGAFSAPSSSDPAQPGSGTPSDAALDARNRQLAGVTRGVGGSDVLVVGLLAAPATRPRLLRRARQVERETPPAEVPLSLVTFVKGTQPLDDRREAARMLGAIRVAEREQERWVKEGLIALNLAIRAYRAGAPDPYATEVTRRDPRKIRIGYGTTEEVQDGRWQEALELPPPARRRTKRIERLRPSEAVAVVLSGRARVLESEDLLLRALIDLDQGRTRGAAFQAASAMRLLPRELESEPRTYGLDRESLAANATRTEELADVAAAGQLDSAQVAELEAIIDSVAGALDTWRYRTPPPTE